MKNTTLGYIEKDGCWLMLHRVKKENDINHDKWIGIGGKVENEETILDCMKRETYEETGLIWKDPKLRGIVTFCWKGEPEDEMITEQMFLYTGKEFSGELKICDEGVLEWIPIEEVKYLPLWKGDHIFLSLLRQRDHPFFYLKLVYIGDELQEAVLNEKELDLDFNAGTDFDAAAEL